MVKLYNLFESIILESVARNEINDAIDNHYRVTVNYDSDEETTATGPRTIEVYAFGISKAGNLVIRVFQPFGDTKTRIPEWKLFRVDRITSWKPTGFKFYKAVNDRASSSGIHSYNPSGDNSMSTVYNQAKFK